jgi:hypothetical protein
MVQNVEAVKKRLCSTMIGNFRKCRSSGARPFDPSTLRPFDKLRVNKLRASRLRVNKLRVNRLRATRWR